MYLLIIPNVSIVSGQTAIVFIDAYDVHVPKIHVSCVEKNSYGTLLTADGVIRWFDLIVITIASFTMFVSFSINLSIEVGHKQKGSPL